MDRWRRRFWILLVIVVGVPLVIGILLAIRFLPDRPVTYAKIEEHFKYGSTGGYQAGFPYWIWKAMPVVFKDKLPKNGGQGYEAFGMVYEPGHDLPVGMQKGRDMGIDRVFVNCAVCHHSTVRDTPASPPRIYLGMPSARLDLGAFEQFLFDIATDQRFDAADIVPEIERQSGSRLSPLDRTLVYPAAIALMQQRLMTLRERIQPQHPESWGPGRVDTFNAAKAYFNFPIASLPDGELHGAADFPSIWNQGKKRGMQLHWDGNNTDVTERNKNAAFGTGTTPATVDLDAIGRLETWLWTLEAPPYPYPIDQQRAARGAVLYKEYCASCHGVDGKDFTGEYVGKVTPIEQIGTDRYRLDSFTYDLMVNLGTPYAGEPYRFKHFIKTYGYANLPLDGLWLRAPYLHNGSVPTLRDLLEPSANRPMSFFRGYDVYDPVKVGFIGTVGKEVGKEGGEHIYFRFDARRPDGSFIPGNGNYGHDGKAYGTLLPNSDKDALVEYLKTF